MLVLRAWYGELWQDEDTKLYAAHLGAYSIESAPDVCKFDPACARILLFFMQNNAQVIATGPHTSRRDGDTCGLANAERLMSYSCDLTRCTSQVSIVNLDTNVSVFSTQTDNLWMSITPGEDSIHLYVGEEEPIFHRRIVLKSEGTTAIPEELMWVYKDRARPFLPLAWDENPSEPMWLMQCRECNTHISYVNRSVEFEQKAYCTKEFSTMPIVPEETCMFPLAEGHVGADYCPVCGILVDSYKFHKVSPEKLEEMKKDSNCQLALHTDESTTLASKEFYTKTTL